MSAPAGSAELPWRGPGRGRPDLALPPGRMPLFEAGTLRKRWRYVGVFCEQLMLCAARVEVGPFRQTFWAIVDRRTGELIERTTTPRPGGRGEVWSEGVDGRPWAIGSAEPGVVTHLRASCVQARIRFEGGRWAESVCPADRAYVWTRKRSATVRCEVELADGRSWHLDGAAIEDESAGYHPRRTSWRWCAGVGTAADGRPLGWNLVDGVNDPPARSERAIWAGEELWEPGPVAFEGLEAIRFDDGHRLWFAAEAERRADHNKLLIRSRYRQPFGTFSGSLAGGVELVEGFGVMEDHEALW